MRAKLTHFAPCTEADRDRVTGRLGGSNRVDGEKGRGRVIKRGRMMEICFSGRLPSRYNADRYAYTLGHEITDRRSEEGEARENDAAAGTREKERTKALPRAEDTGVARGDAR